MGVLQQHFRPLAMVGCMYCAVLRLGGSVECASCQLGGSTERASSQLDDSMKSLADTVATVGKLQEVGRHGMGDAGKWMAAGMVAVAMAHAHFVKSK